MKAFNMYVPFAYISLSVFTIVLGVGHNEKCSKEIPCTDDGDICVDNQCKCSALQFYKPHVNECTDEVLNGAACRSLFACRKDLGLLCKLGRCKCDSGSWTEQTQKCEGLTTKCSDDVKHEAFHCWSFVEKAAKDITSLFDVRQMVASTLYLCGKHATDGIKCADNLLQLCPEFKDQLMTWKDNPTADYRRHMALKGWIDTNCNSPQYAEFKQKQTCANQNVSDAFKKCLRSVPSKDKETDLYSCGTGNQLWHCFNSAVGLSCGETAARVVFSAVKVLNITEPDSCSPGGGASFTNSYSSLLIVMCLDILLKIKLTLS